VTTPDGRAASPGTPIHLNAGARALDALDAQDAAVFDEHLAGCESCRTELAEFEATAASLGAAVSQVPPAVIRERVLRAISVSPQLPPVTLRAVPEMAPAPTSEKTPGTAAAPAAGGRRPRPWLRRPVTMLAAAAVILAIAVGAVLLAARPAPKAVDASAAMAECVSSAPDAHMMMPSVGTAGDVMMAPSCHAAVVRVDGLPTLPGGQTYQLWVMAPNGARSVGMLGPDPSPTQPMVTAVKAGDTDIRVSVEPATGSAAPTSGPVWMVHL
jgi:hypothetical protein